MLATPNRVLDRTEPGHGQHTNHLAAGEHFADAERLLHSRLLARRRAERDRRITAAQVHATLAIAAVLLGSAEWQRTVGQQRARIEASAVEILPRRLRLLFDQCAQCLIIFTKCA
jgi:hypothetical protein